MANTISYEQIKNFLIEGSNTVSDKKTIVVLFNNTKQKDEVTNSIVEELRHNPLFVVNRKSPLVFKNNYLRVNNYSIFCGLPINEKYLYSVYPKNTIFYYEEKAE